MLKEKATELKLAIQKWLIEQKIPGLCSPPQATHENVASDLKALPEGSLFFCVRINHKDSEERNRLIGITIEHIEADHNQWVRMIFREGKSNLILCAVVPQGTDRF